MLHIEGRLRIATPTFGKPVNLMGFRLVGTDGVERLFTDFSFISRNREGSWTIPTDRDQDTVRGGRLTSRPKANQQELTPAMTIPIASSCVAH